MISFSRIRLSCGQIIKEEENNLFGERVYRELQVRVDFTDDSLHQIQSIEMGNLINANSGDPIMIFLGMTLLKDECSKLFLRGSYVRNQINSSIYYCTYLVKISLVFNYRLFLSMCRNITVY